MPAPGAGQAIVTARIGIAEEEPGAAQPDQVRRRACDPDRGTKRSGRGVDATSLSLVAGWHVTGTQRAVSSAFCLNAYIVEQQSHFRVLISQHQWGGLRPDVESKRVPALRRRVLANSEHHERPAIPGHVIANGAGVASSCRRKGSRLQRCRGQTDQPSHSELMITIKAQA